MAVCGNIIIIKEDYEFLKSLEVNEEDKEKLQIIADKVHGIYFESQNENIELKDDIKNYYNILNKAIKEKRKGRKKNEKE